MIRGDARQLPALLPLGTAGRAALVVTSPPYGSSVHGQVKAEQRHGQGGGVRKYDNRYGHDPANLASQHLDEPLAGFTQILAGCAVLLRPPDRTAMGRCCGLPPATCPTARTRTRPPGRGSAPTSPQKTTATTPPQRHTQTRRAIIQ